MNLLNINPHWYKKINFNNPILNFYGGADKFIFELSLALADKIKTTFVTFGTYEKHFRFKNLNIILLKSKPFLPQFNGKCNFLSVKLFSLCKNFNIIHAHQYYADTTLIACLAAKIYGKKVFVTDLGWRGLNLARYFPAKLFATKVLGLTLYDKERFGLSNNKFDAINAGVNLEKYLYHDRKERKVIFIGRLLPHKGINYLIEALDFKTECIIAGHKCDNKYFSLLKSLSKKKNVKFLLSATDKEIITHLQESSILILPSVEKNVYGVKKPNPELFGLVITEAWACGTPVIVSNAGALPYVVDDGINGFVVPQNDPDSIKVKINYLLENPNMITNMGRNGREKVENVYNWDNTANICMKNYIET